MQGDMASRRIAKAACHQADTGYAGSWRRLASAIGTNLQEPTTYELPSTYPSCFNSRELFEQKEAEHVEALHAGIGGSVTIARGNAESLT